jgi:hypothetical protein
VSLTNYDIIALTNAKNYTYAELGIFTETNCMYNGLVAFSQHTEMEYPGTYLNLYLAISPLPNSNYTKIYWSEEDELEGRSYYA